MRTLFPLVLALLSPLSACGGGDAPEPSPSVARTAQVTLVDAEQLAAKIAAAKGRGLLVNLWAMW